MSPADAPSLLPLIAADCSLGPSDQPTRVAELGDLFAAVVTNAERVNSSTLRLTLRHDADVAAEVARFVTQEVGCCDFFTFTLVVTAGSLFLDVAVSPGHEAVLDGLMTKAAQATTLGIPG